MASVVVRIVALWTWQRWVVAALAAGLAAVLIGVPTGIIHTSFYTRMTPVLWWNYPIWIASSILTGIVAATYVRAGEESPKRVTGRVGLGSVLSLFAVGCPICNKLVVALIGVSGALDLWAPIQPVLGLVSVGLLAYAVRLRVSREVACAVPQRTSG